MKKLSLFLVCLLVISFWFEGNTLFWLDSVNVSKYGELNKSNWLRFQLDHKNPPTINQKDIKYIKVDKEIVYIHTKDKYWVLHYTQNTETLDWYVEDWVKR